jgi:hypothetical protein
MPVEEPGVPVRWSPTRSLDIVLDRTPVRKLEFVDIDPTPLRPQRRRAASVEASAPAATIDTVDAAVGDGPDMAAGAAIDSGEPRWSLWGDVEA